jgi:hypothetical protein
MGVGQGLFFGFLLLCTLATVAIFLEEAVFIYKVFRPRQMLLRAKYIYYILGIYPVGTHKQLRPYTEQ